MFYIFTFVSIHTALMFVRVRSGVLLHLIFSQICINADSSLHVFGRGGEKVGVESPEELNALKASR